MGRILACFNNLTKGRFMKKFILTLATTALCLSVSSAYANKGHEYGKMREDIMKELKLTPQQKTKMDSIREATKDKFQSLRDHMKTAHEKMKAAMKADNDADIRAAHQEMQSVMDEMSAAHFDAMMERRKVLNADQRKKMASLKEKYMEKEMKEHHGCMMGHDGCMMEHDED